MDLFNIIVSEFLNFLSLLLTSWLALDQKLDSVTTFDTPLQTYDFIIVGAGSSGSILANKLSENYSVLLLEAGGSPDPILSIPTLAFIVHGHDPVIWRRYTVPQQNSSKGLNDNRTFWPSGIGVGGSTLINGMIYIRGNNLGYNTLTNRTGDPSWSLESVLKYFREVENYHGRFKDGNHGTSGGMHVESGYASPVSETFLTAGEELGYKIRDPNAFDALTEGFAPPDFYMKHGSRWDAYHGYIEPIMSRPTLSIRKYAFAKRILTRGGSEAYGIVYDRNGIEHIALAKKEVILSAGAIGSAKLLMLSGIGPKDHLIKLGIPLVSDLPVGRNLQDKYGALIGPFSVDHGKSFQLDRDVNPATLAEYELHGTGPLTSTRIEGSFAISSSVSKKEGTDKDPDINSYLIAFSADNHTKDIFQKSFNMRPEVAEYYSKIPAGQDSFVQLVTVSKPSSSGVLELKSNNPYDEPLLDPKYLQTQRDVDIMVEGIKFSIDLVDNTNTFKAIHGKFSENTFPGCESFEFKSMGYYECIARHATLTAYKYGGTAPIGKDKTDPEAVVNSRLKVLGFQNLRVVDGSVLQEKFTSVNDVTCKMVATLATDRILSDWSEYQNDYELDTNLINTNVNVELEPSSLHPAQLLLPKPPSTDVNVSVSSNPVSLPPKPFLPNIPTAPSPLSLPIVG